MLLTLHKNILGMDLEEIGHMTRFYQANFIYAYIQQNNSVEGVYDRAST
ncbi:MAG: hypothetical protein NVS4B12_22830 [Ktedonobacteraceae bacterium]